MDSSSSAAWYAQLSKPFFAPPAGVFGPVWTVLYVIIAVSFGFVLLQYLRRRLPFRVLLPFILNLLANLAYTPIQFGLKNNALASLDILLVLGTLVWAMAAIRQRARWVVWVNIPYLLWVLFATVLQLSITWLNRGA
ncbi:TspO/MBR family protein [Polaromonas sp. YR568]|uniref:TspO/MBR family protein n=1 Tax=Polaromonas sp. YR568 TaxID=1855301 RepID=UPI0027240730|nr:TspO/MBR family protein [Polaromonas sp.]